MGVAGAAGVLALPYSLWTVPKPRFTEAELEALIKRAWAIADPPVMMMGKEAYDTFARIEKRESLDDIIFNISPIETPFMSLHESEFCGLRGA